MNRRLHLRPRLTLSVVSALLASLSISAMSVGAEPSGGSGGSQGGGLPTLEKRVTTVETNVQELNTTTEVQALDLAELTNRVLALESTVSQLQSQVSSLQTEMTAVKNQVARLEADVAALKAKVASLEGTVSTLQTAVTDLQGQLTALQALASQLQAKLNALNTLSGLSSGVKRLLSWVQLPTVTYYLSAWPFELDLTCPVGVPLQAMLAGAPTHIESMQPVLNDLDLRKGVEAPTALDIAAPAGIKVRFTVGMGTPGPSPGWFPVVPYVLCLNVDGLTSMATNLADPIVP